MLRTRSSGSRVNRAIDRVKGQDLTRAYDNAGCLKGALEFSQSASKLISQIVQEADILAELCIVKIRNNVFHLYVAAFSLGAIYFL